MLLCTPTSGTTAEARSPTGDPLPGAGKSAVYVYPRREDRRLSGFYPGIADREALVYIRFSVSASGEVADVEQKEGGFHEPRFVSAAKTVVRRMKFLPATLNGVPVDASGLVMPVRFSIQDEEKGVTPEFREELIKVVQLVKDKDFAGAHFHAQWMLSEKVLYSFEYATLMGTLAQTQANVGELHRALTSSRHATARVSMNLDQYTPGGPLPEIKENDFILTKDVLGPLLKLRFFIAQSQGLYLEALRAHADLQALGMAPQSDPTMADFSAILEKTLKDPYITGTARINDEGYWEHELYFRTVAVRDVTGGSLGDIGVECAERRSRLEFTANVEWSFPSSWQGCTVRFTGTPGTRFRIVEFRARSPAG